MDETSLDQQEVGKLQSLGVSLVYLFGSVAEGTDHGLSDLDLGVVFDQASRLGPDNSSLYNSLYDIFTDGFPDRNIDIVFLDNAGLELCFDAISHGRLLFASSSDARYAFEEKVLILYADFRPILEEFDAAVLERIRP